MRKPLISICIPCYKRADYVRNTLNSIFDDNSEVPLDLYEVVISDNDPQREIASVIEDFDYPNLKYYCSECEGFLNSYMVLKYGKGDFLKLLNSQSCFRKGGLSALIDLVHKDSDMHSVILSTNGQLEMFNTNTYLSFDNFMFASSYYTSWSNSFGVWRDDFEKLSSGIILNELFPHTSVLMNLSYKTSFIIDDRKLFQIQKVLNKGGHNMFKSFSIDYTSFIESKKQTNDISYATYSKIKSDLVGKFFPHLYFKTKIIRVDSYDSYGFKQNLRKYYPKGTYSKIIFLSYLYPFVFGIKLLKNKFKNENYN